MQLNWSCSFSTYTIFRNLNKIIIIVANTWLLLKRWAGTLFLRANDTDQLTKDFKYAAELTPKQACFQHCGAVCYLDAPETY